VFDLKGKVAWSRVVTGHRLGMAQGSPRREPRSSSRPESREVARGATEIERRGGTAIAIDVDVTSEASVDAMTKAPWSGSDA